METIGQRLCRIRGAVGMTQHRLAVRAGLIPSTISRWERDHGEPGASSILALARALGVEPGALLEGDEVPEVGR